MKHGWPFTKKYPITSKFGDLAGRASAHRGLDIGVAEDYFKGPVLVYPTAAGTVITAETLSDGAKGVRVKHADGMITEYWHLDRIDVKVGKAVTRTTPLGLAGKTGNASGPHLHLEFKPGSASAAPQNPLNYLDLNDLVITNTMPATTQYQVPADFIGAVYTIYNPDVAAELAKGGWLKSAEQHYSLYGHKEIAGNPNRNKYRLSDLIAEKDATISQLRNELNNRPVVDPLKAPEVQNALQVLRGEKETLERKLLETKEQSNIVNPAVLEAYLSDLLEEGKVITTASHQEKIASVQKEHKHIVDELVAERGKIVNEYELRIRELEAEKVKYQVSTAGLSWWDRLGVWLLQKAKSLPIKDSYKVAPRYAMILSTLLALPLGSILLVFGVDLETALKSTGGVFGVSYLQLYNSLITTMKRIDKQIEDGELTKKEVMVNIQEWEK